MNSSDFRQLAWGKLSGNWGGPIAVSLVYLVITSILSYITQNMLYAGLITVIVTAPLQIGLYKYYILFSKSLNPEFDVLFDGFKESFVKSILLTYLTGIFIFLWLLLLIIPGIIKAFAYAMAPYILAEDPNIGITEALDRSQEMMNGYKMDLFILILSFFGWFLLGIVTLGIAFIWVAPYVSLAMAEFYLQVSGGNTVADVVEEQPQAEEDSFDSFLLK
jgi:uncharacterized membrane protein